MQAFSTFALVLALSVLVALPSVLAIVRRHPNRLPITIVNVLFGWTIVGWIAALVWVLKPVKVRKPRARKTSKARTISKGDAAANDNVSTPVYSSMTEPALLDSDVYEDWLEQGSALAEADAGSVVPAPSAKPAAAEPIAA